MKLCKNLGSYVRLKDDESTFLTIMTFTREEKVLNMTNVKYGLHDRSTINPLTQVGFRSLFYLTHVTYIALLNLTNTMRMELESVPSKLLLTTLV